MNLITCERCGMMWTERYWSHAEMLGSAPMGEGTLREAHVCPKPYPRAVAESFVQMAQAYGGIVVSLRQKAAIKLGLLT